MHTIIRLQIRGKNKQRYYRLIAIGHKKRMKGKGIEILGYWYPKQVSQQQRSVVINKDRIRYWISRGAVFQGKVQQLLSFYNLYNRPWIKFGTKTNYKQKDENEVKRGIERFHRDLVERGDSEETTRIKLENFYFRQIKYDNNFSKIYGENELQAFQDIIMEEDNYMDENVEFRSEKFYFLKRKYLEIESNLEHLDPLQNELLFKKLNELANKGIYT